MARGSITIEGREYRIVTNGERFRIERRGQFFRKRWHFLRSGGYDNHILDWATLVEAEDFLIDLAKVKAKLNPKWRPVSEGETYVI